MIILSIETSCDDTSISIMECSGGVRAPSFRVLADVFDSQIEVHRPHGGVFPMLAKREHIKNLPILLERALQSPSIKKLSKKLQKITKNKMSTNSAIAESVDTQPPIDAIAVTYGPGLEPALWTGITFAQELAERWGVPVIPVNHMEGHIVSVFGKDNGKFTMPGVYTASSKSKKGIKTPVLSLLVSGGHTQLVLSKRPARPDDTGRLGGWMHYEIIGETVDDAVGEAFDKVARTLGLPYPGGPEISRLAEEARRNIRSSDSSRAESAGGSGFSLPRPMLHTKDLNFSFSGLKTAVLYLVRDIKSGKKLSAQGGPVKDWKRTIALEFENAAVECLVHKTSKAIDKYNINTLIVSGGVSCNTHLKNEMQKVAKDKEIKLYFPTARLATDNSLMIGIAGYLQYLKKKGKFSSPKKIKATGDLKLGVKGSL